jgi:hypothetical protein
MRAPPHIACTATYIYISASIQFNPRSLASKRKEIKLILNMETRRLWNANLVKQIP